MNQSNNGFADTSRDLGAWAADVADVPGVDEVSLTAKMMGMMFESFTVDNEHFNKLPPIEFHFYDERRVAPSVFGEEW